MAKVYTNEHTNRFVLVRQYLKDLLKQQKADDILKLDSTKSKKIEECIDKLFEYKKLMPEYIKNLMKKGESFDVEKNGYKHYLMSDDIKDEIEGRIEVPSEELAFACEYFAYMDHAQFENKGLEYCFQITQRCVDVCTPGNAQKKCNLTKKWVITMDPIGRDCWNELLNFVKINYEEWDDVTNDRRELTLFTNISAGDFLNISISDKSGNEDKPQCWDIKKFYSLAEEELNVLKDYAGVPRRESLIKNNLPF